LTLSVTVTVVHGAERLNGSE